MIVIKNGLNICMNAQTIIFIEQVSIEPLCLYLSSAPVFIFSASDYHTGISSATVVGSGNRLFHGLHIIPDWTDTVFTVLLDQLDDRTANDDAIRIAYC